jgi:hypothetical protein
MSKKKALTVSDMFRATFDLGLGMIQAAAKGATVYIDERNKNKDKDEKNEEHEETTFEDRASMSLREFAKAAIDGAKRAQKELGDGEDAPQGDEEGPKTKGGAKAKGKADQNGAQKPPKGGAPAEQR